MGIVLDSLYRTGRGVRLRTFERTLISRQEFKLKSVETLFRASALMASGTPLAPVRSVVFQAMFFLCQQNLKAADLNRFFVKTEVKLWTKKTLSILRKRRSRSVCILMRDVSGIFYFCQALDQGQRFQKNTLRYWRMAKSFLTNEAQFRAFFVPCGIF